MTNDLFFSLLQLLGGIILTVGYIPQIAKIIKIKNVESFSLGSLNMVLLGIGLMEVYAIYLVLSSGKGMAFLVTNTLSLLCSLMMVLLALKYKKS